MVYIIEVFKIFNDDNISAEYYFMVDRSNTTIRWSGVKIIGERFLSNETKHFFNQVINVWNYL